MRVGSPVPLRPVTVLNPRLHRLFRGQGLRLLALLVLLVAAVVLALTVSLPSPGQVRQWADTMGPAFPVVFLLCHTIITVAPVPRTALTLMAGLLLGPVTGIAVALTATALSAVLALLIVRKLGREAVARRVRHRALQAVDDRLERRGWLAVTSLRLIPIVPFAVLNYCCGVSSVRLGQYAFGTIVGIIPGTVAVVLLGDAITGQTSPLLLSVSVACGCVGVLGLFADARATVNPAS